VSRRPPVTRVDVVIDEVVVHGLARPHVAALVSSLERTLTALAISDPPRLGAAAATSLDLVRPRALSAAPHSGAALGAHTAAVIWRAIGGRR
jgi:hypothetical protein